ncbi:phosphodiester glycosidase family protein [Streptacidiphilus rugosus]|uniref:phosphodiester glycosidase family protein n=1 Tax=Streptacidiphilus rugosus TaxID=405783 RepID=UPI000A061DA9|nr:phosphodiester glycosidase family protein [Streptacidiphilus rugosus]
MTNHDADIPPTHAGRPTPPEPILRQAPRRHGATAPPPRRRGRRRMLPWKHPRDLTRTQRHRRRIVTRGLLATGLACAGWLGWSIGQALTYPGRDGVEARLAEWGRDHHLGLAVNQLEDWQYALNPPRVGGSLTAAELARMRATQEAAPQGGAVPLRVPMPTSITPRLPGEGVWRALVTSHGLPLVQGTYVRPDAEHSSYEAAIAWISASHARFFLHPGFREPGGSFSVPPTIPVGQRNGLIATWNGGFRITDGTSKGGFYLDGRTDSTLRVGAASEVFYRDGSIRVGTWGRDVTMTPQVVGVRQCLQLMVDGGLLASDIDVPYAYGWAYQGKKYVERSGVGVTANGDIVMVVGQALSARTLAELMQHAGAVRAMPLDMNGAWPSFMSYDASVNPANPKPANLLDFGEAADRYYTQATRDFVAVYAR